MKRTIVSTDFVEGIVAQIQKQIAKTRASNSLDQNNVPSRPDYRERLAEESGRLADLDTQIEAAAKRIGGKPPAPATWRGRFGSWAIDFLRRLLWWYTAPIQQTLDLIDRRNREQSSTLLQVQEQMLSLMDDLRQARSQINELKASNAASDSLQAEMAQRMAELARGVSGVDVQLRLEAESRKALAREINSRIEQVEQSVKSQVHELKVSNEVSDASRAELARRVADAAHAIWGRLPVLETQLQAEIEARETLARETKGDLENLRAHKVVSDSLRAEMAERGSEAAHATWERVSAIETQLRAVAEAREALAVEVGRQMDELKGALRVPRLP